MLLIKQMYRIGSEIKRFTDDTNIDCAIEKEEDVCGLLEDTNGLISWTEKYCLLWSS